jgi:hypothetical protein
VIFGATVSGRPADLPGVEEIELGRLPPQPASSDDTCGE